MRKILLASVALVLLGCEAPSEIDPQKQAVMSYLACLHKAARALDDHHSDASTIAEAVARKCTGERDEADVVPNYTPPDVSAATTVVLDERSKGPN